MYPKIRVDFDPIQANLPVLPTANAAQAEPTRLRVRRICIYVDDSPCRCSDALAHCPESLWVHFSDVALRFPHLQHVEVIKSSRRSEWSENLNLRNRAFQLLIEAGKFKFRYLDSSPEPVPGRLESKMPETRCARCTQSGYLLNVFLHRVIPLVLEQVGTARLFRTSDLPGLQHILDEVPAYRYHWQLWNDRHTRVRVAMDFVRRWQSGFASTAIRGLKILVAHMTKILESKGMASDEIPAAVADIIKEQLGWFRCSCCDKRERVFWYWYDENEESMTPKPYPFETPLVLYTLTHHVDTVGRQVFFKRMSDPHCQWKPPLGALMLSVLAAEHALRAFSAGVFVEPAPFLAADAEDGYPVEVGVCRVDVTQVTRMEDIIKERNLTREHWKDFFRSALLMQDILDVRLGRDNECKPPSIPSIKLGVPWDGINIPVAEW
ncbi:hypothetical protein PsYK624_152600 [Phanerochaete sordida]|uniref:Uncharacterized protein n=1 Tax=Phanerochaete sordida TaxID=48140 RepID=A0A9P3GP76_9APHY|nr:hypothetical protein PsYK624_152600 [Phanerochaete sordida]